MIKYLLLAAFVYVAFIWLQRAAAGARKSARSGAPGAQEKMVTCAHCGVHLPQSESVSEGSRIFCTDEHRIAGPK
jgi:uncharacterized protein